MFALPAFGTILRRMGIQASGRLHVVFDTKQVTERFQKREFVVEMTDNPNYPQFVLFQLTGDRCDNIEGFSVGDNVRVEFNLRGREWTSPNGEVKYFNSLDVWTIEADGPSASRGDDEPPPFDESPPLDDVPF